MAPEFFLSSAIGGAMQLLPTNMNSPQARAMILAICLQESRLEFRRQVGGPARGFAQFELGGGVTGVLNHPSTATHSKVICTALNIVATPQAVYTALELNDVLAASFARLLLWTLPTALAGKDNPEAAWKQYIAAWRPGAPHREQWNANFAHAWLTVESTIVADPKIDAIRIAAITFMQGLDKLRATISSLQ